MEWKAACDWITKMPIQGGPSTYMLRSMIDFWRKNGAPDLHQNGTWKRDGMVADLKKFFQEIKEPMTRSQRLKMNDLLLKCESDLQLSKEKKETQKKYKEEDEWTREHLSHTLDEYQTLIESWGIPLDELEQARPEPIVWKQIRYPEIRYDTPPIIVDRDFYSDLRQYHDIDNRGRPSESFPIQVKLPPLDDILTIHLQVMRYARLNCNLFNNALYMRMMFKVVTPSNLTTHFKAGTVSWVTRRQMLFEMPQYLMITFPLLGNLSAEHRCTFSTPRERDFVSDSMQYRRNHDLNTPQSFIFKTLTKKECTIATQNMDVISMSHTRFFAHLSFLKDSQQQAVLQIAKELDTFHMPRELLQLIRDYVFLEKELDRKYLNLDLNRLIQQVKNSDKEKISDTIELSDDDETLSSSSSSDEQDSDVEVLESPRKKLKV